MQCVAQKLACRAPFGAARLGSSTRRSALVVRAVQQQPKQAPELPAVVKPAALTALANVLLSMPAHAEAGKIFDFNLTGPIMAVQFLVLMVFLDKFWFGPVGKLLDSRDAELRSKLGEVKDNGAEIARLQAEAEKLLAEARAKAQKDVAEAKAKFSAEAAKQLAEAKAKVDAELERSLSALESEKAAALRDLDKQVDKLAADILSRVLPEGVKV